MIRVQQLLVEKENCIKNSSVNIFLNIGNNFRLKRQWVKVGENHLIQFSDINNHIIVFFSITVKLLNDKNGKTEGGGIGSKLKLALAVYFVKGFIDDMAKVISKKVNSWFQDRYFQFLFRFKMNLHPTLWKNLNKALRFLNKRILSN